MANWDHINADGEIPVSVVQRLKSGSTDGSLLKICIKKGHALLGSFDCSKKSGVEELYKVKQESTPIICEESSAIATRAVTDSQNLDRSVEEHSNEQESEELVTDMQQIEPFVHEKSSRGTTCSVAKVQDTNLSEGCNTATGNPKAMISLIGIRMLKNGRYAAVVTDPCRHKKIWFCSFDTAEEASEAYFKKKSEFEKLSQGYKVKEAKSFDQLQPESSSLSLTNDQTLNNYSLGSNKRTDSHKTAHIHGAHKRKSGKYTSEIRNPISRKKIWLGTFDTAEEASEAYFKKKSKFEKLSQGYKVNEAKSCDQLQPESLSLSSANDQTLNNSSVGRNKRIDSHKTTHILGAYKSKSGKYYSDIKDPISKKRIYLGTFVTAEEASQAYQLKKLEFQKLVKAKQQFNRKTYSSENMNQEGFQPKSAGGASSSGIDIPIPDSSNGGSYQKIDSHEISDSVFVTSEITNPISTTKTLSGAVGTAEEAVHAYQSKEFDFHSSKKAKLQSDMPPHASAGEKQGSQEDEDLWMGQWVQLPGDKAVKFSLKLGLPIVDNYGFLLGEFSSLDDLSIR